MRVGSGPELSRAGDSHDVGIVMLGESLQLHYINDQAREYMDRAGSADATLPHRHDLRLEIIELGTQVRERNSAGSWLHPDGGEAGKSVRTKQGTCYLRALRVVGGSARTERDIMSLIEDRISGRLSSKLLKAAG